MPSTDRGSLFFDNHNRNDVLDPMILGLVDETKNEIQRMQSSLKVLPKMSQ